MNFQSLANIEKPETYVQVAFNTARTRVGKINIRKSRSRDEKLLILCKDKIKKFEASLKKQLQNIVENFPKIDELPEFYSGLCRLTFDVDTLKKSLYTIKWSTQKIEELTAKYLKIIGQTKKLEKEREYYGRVTSIVKGLRTHLLRIEAARKTMKGFPAIKTDLYTVAIAGFPNVGKSTLLSKITTAKPEIQSYAFTTKRLNLGYATIGSRKIQFIDTPGTLDRLEKMNNIEKQAYLVMSTLANSIVYVFDPTEPYSLVKQQELLKKIREFNKPIIIYVSKTDIVKIKDKNFLSEDAILEPEKLIKEILRLIPK
jgi:nucleolar GTP-binding protein